MRLSDITFEDDNFRAAVLATGVEHADEVEEIRARKQAIHKVNGLEYFPNLKLLDLTRNLLDDIDVSNNPQLEELYLGNNDIDFLDLSQNPELKHLEIFINNIAELDTSTLPKLENLYANKNDLTGLDLSYNPNIEEIQLNDNDLEALTLPEDCPLFIVKVKNTKLGDDMRKQLKARVAEHNLQL